MNKVSPFYGILLVFLRSHSLKIIKIGKIGGGYHEKHVLLEGGYDDSHAEARGGGQKCPKIRARNLRTLPNVE